MMKTFCLFLFAVVALANSVVALEANKTLVEANTAPTKAHRHGSKDLQLVPLGQSLAVTKTDEHLTGFAGIIAKYSGKLGAAFAAGFPATTAAVKAKLTSLTTRRPFAKAVTVFNAWKTKHAAALPGLKLVANFAFAAADAVVTALIVIAFPPTVGILIADAAIELAKAVYDMAGGGSDTDAQTARVAYQGINLVLAIGGIDGCVGTGLAEAMSEFWYATSSNIAGEIADAAGGSLAPAASKETERNAKLQAKFTGQTVSAGTKKRKMVYGGNPSGDQFKVAATTSQS